MGFYGGTKRFINTGLSNTGGDMYSTGEGCKEMHTSKLLLRVWYTLVLLHLVRTGGARGWVPIFGLSYCLQ